MDQCPHAKGIPDLIHSSISKNRSTRYSLCSYYVTAISRRWLYWLIKNMVYHNRIEGHSFTLQRYLCRNIRWKSKFLRGQWCQNIFWGSYIVNCMKSWKKPEGIWLSNPYSWQLREMYSRESFMAISILKPEQNGLHFADEISKHISMNIDHCILVKSSLIFVPRDWQ